MWHRVLKFYMKQKTLESSDGTEMVVITDVTSKIPGSCL